MGAEIYSVSLYKYKDGPILLTPFTKNEEGIHTNVNRPEQWLSPDGGSEIGRMLRKTTQAAIEETGKNGESRSVYMEAAGVKSWRTFKKDRAFVDAAYESGKGYSLYPGITLGRTDQPRGITLDEGVSDQTIGEAVLEVFTRYREK